MHARSIDFSKAFERVVHKRLLSKIQERCVFGDVVRMLIFNFNNSCRTVEVIGPEPSRWNVSRGLQQGGVLRKQNFFG